MTTPTSARAMAIRAHGDQRYGELPYVTHLDEIEPADLSADLSSVAYLRTPVGGQYTRETVPRVGVECRDTGLAWLCKEPLKHIRARMHEVSVWAVFDGGNYDNIIEYVFREDGSMGFRYGVTGFVHPGVPQVAHMHNSLWRVSTSLFGRTDNAVFQSHHLKLGDLTADDTETPVSNETSINLAPTEFTSLIVRSSSKKNARGNPMGYEFGPWNRLGTARQSSNPSDQQLWTLSDFHVTNDRPGEDGTGTAPNNWRFSSGWRSPDEYLLKYTKRNSPVPSNNDSIAIWYNAAVHHEPSDLDNQKLLSSPIYSGVTPIHRSGFDLMPHNFFDFNPIGGPAACHVP